MSKYKYSYISYNKSIINSINIQNFIPLYNLMEAYNHLKEKWTSLYHRHGLCSHNSLKLYFVNRFVHGQRNPSLTLKILGLDFLT